MALGTNQITTTPVGSGTASKFVPDLWSDEIAAKYKANLVAANLIARMDHTGKYGATVHVPSPTRSSASSFFASQGNQITPTVATETEFTIVINQHWVNAKQIPDVAEKQILPSYRRFITDDLSYSLALAVDNFLHQYVFTNLRNSSGTPDYATTWNSNTTVLTGSVIGSDGATAWSKTGSGNGTALADVGIRTVIQTLDDQDIPGMDRFFVIPPVEKKRLMGVPRFTEQAFVGEQGAGNTMRNGHVGDLYGTPVYVSSNCAIINATAGAQTLGFGGGGTNYRQVVYAHRDSAVLVEQIKPRVQAQYKVEYLSDVLVADVLFGAALVRTQSAPTPALADRGVSIIVPYL